MKLFEFLTSFLMIFLFMQFTSTRSVFSSSSSSGSAKKPTAIELSRAIPEVKPITLNGIRYEVLMRARDRGLAQAGGHIAAFDSKNNQELWTMRVYKTDFIPFMEREIQEVYIEALSRSSKDEVLNVIDEKGRHYSVEVSSRKILPTYVK